MDKNTMNKLKPALLGLVIIIICAVKAFSGSGVISSDKDDSSSKKSSSSVSSSVRSVPDKRTETTTKKTESKKEIETTTTTEATTTTAAETTAATVTTDKEYVEYYFRTKKLRDSHYEKHGIDMGFASADEYRHAASDVINNPDALMKREKEDNDYCYYLEETDEFVVLSTDGYIRTYFNPGGKDYFDRQ